MSDNRRAFGIFVRVGAASAAVAAIMALIGYFPTVRLAGAAGVTAMFVGIGISLIGAWVGVTPTIAYLGKPAREHPTGILAGLGVRFAVTLGLALAAALTDMFARLPLLWWVGISQFVILGVDVFGLVGLLKRSKRDD